MNCEEPKVSVLVPVYNAERYVGKTLDSVLSQTWSDFELLALDDGSTDGSLTILREFEVKDRRVRVHSRQHVGLVPSRNELIGFARGPYLALIDSDDICRPQRFEKQVAYLDAHSECVAVGSRALIIDSGGMPIIKSTNELTHDEMNSAHLSKPGGSRMYNSSVMMRKAAVIQVGQYREDYRFSEDIDLFLRLAEIGKLSNLPDVLLEYRQHLRSVSYAHYGEQLDNARKAVIAARLRRGLIAGLQKSESETDPELAADTHRKWAWWALSAGNLTTARKHAIIALVMRPFNIENLRAVVCSIRGY